MSKKQDPKQAPKKSGELDDQQLESAAGGLGGLSARAFNPQPEPPRPDSLFQSKLRSRRR